VSKCDREPSIGDPGPLEALLPSKKNRNASCSVFCNLALGVKDPFDVTGGKRDINRLNKLLLGYRSLKSTDHYVSLTRAARICVYTLRNAS
jgi:hypothetical protein